MSDKVEKYLIPHDKNTKQRIKKINFDAYNLPEIFESIKKIKEQNSVLVNYEILVNILNTNFKLN